MPLRFHALLSCTGNYIQSTYAKEYSAVASFSETIVKSWRRSCNGRLSKLEDGVGWLRASTRREVIAIDHVEAIAVTNASTYSKQRSDIGDIE